MLGHLQRFLTLIGRILLGAVFLMTAAGHLVPNFGKIAEEMETKEVPLPAVMLGAGIAFLLAGSLSIIIGFRARLGALLLFVFLGVSCYFMHPFWKFEGEVRENELIHFLKNAALMGAMVLVMAQGAGPLSIDAWRKPVVVPSAPKRFIA
jgi:putative oxidoreductase